MGTYLPRGQEVAIMAAGDRPKSTVVLVVAIVVALVAGTVAGWLLRSTEIADLKDRVAALEDTTATPPPVVEESESVTAPPEAPPAEEPEAEESAPTVERQPGIVTRVTGSAGAYRLKIDYIQFLTGDEAAEAAADAGDESPPPNDYYIVNENPRIREFPIEDSVRPRVVFDDNGGSVPETLEMSLADWATNFNDPTALYYRTNFYWITITDGVVTAIEQQYLP